MLIFIRILLSPWRTQVVQMINEFLGISSSEKKAKIISFRVHICTFAAFFNSNVFHISFDLWTLSCFYIEKAEKKKKRGKSVTVKKSESYNLAQHQYWFATFLPNSLPRYIEI